MDGMSGNMTVNPSKSTSREKNKTMRVPWLLGEGAGAGAGVLEVAVLAPLFSRVSELEVLVFRPFLLDIPLL